MFRRHRESVPFTLVLPFNVFVECLCTLLYRDQGKSPQLFPFPINDPEYIPPLHETQGWTEKRRSINNKLIVQIETWYIEIYKNNHQYSRIFISSCSWSANWLFCIATVCWLLISQSELDLEMPSSYRENRKFFLSSIERTSYGHF